MDVQELQRGADLGLPVREIMVVVTVYTCTASKLRIHLGFLPTSTTNSTLALPVTLANFTPVPSPLQLTVFAEIGEHRCSGRSWVWTKYQIYST
jgi:hypothetical protein